MRKSILFVGGVLVALTVIVCIALSFSGAETDTAVKNITVEVLNGESKEVLDIQTSRTNLADALLDEKIVSGEMGQYGLFIHEVCGIKADEEKQQWWFITKEGEDVFEGVSGIKISDGDKYELTLKTGY